MKQIDLTCILKNGKYTPLNWNWFNKIVGRIIYRKHIKMLKSTGMWDKYDVYMYRGFWLKT